DLRPLLLHRLLQRDEVVVDAHHRHAHDNDGDDEHGHAPKSSLPHNASSESVIASPSEMLAGEAIWNDDPSSKWSPCTPGPTSPPRRSRAHRTRSRGTASSPIPCSPTRRRRASA